MGHSYWILKDLDENVTYTCGLLINLTMANMDICYYKTTVCDNNSLWHRPGSCGLAEFSGCCNIYVEANCFGATGNCYCDEICYEFEDCCDDIMDIGCLC